MPFDFVTTAPGGAKQLSFDFDARPPKPESKPSNGRVTNYYAGLSAEDMVLRSYQKQGATLLERRWRGPGGEIDLILAEGDRIVFVEVKKSKTHARALQRVTQRQLSRITASAEAYLDRCPKGSLTEIRIDVALVDAQGVVELVPNVSVAA